METFTQKYLQESAELIAKLDATSIEALAEGLAGVRAAGGRLFILGVGGSAGHAGHAVNDFRKLCGFEAYAPTDNVSELTARVNDEGWDTCFAEWLRVSRLRSGDGVLVFSVGGGNREKNVSVNLVRSGAGGRPVWRTGWLGNVAWTRAASRRRRPTRAWSFRTVAAELFDSALLEGLCAAVWHLLRQSPAQQTQRSATV